MEKKELMIAIVKKRKKCWFCRPVIKYQTDGCLYEECPKCGTRTVEYTDRDLVRWNWLNGKIGIVVKASTKKKGEHEKRT